MTLTHIYTQMKNEEFYEEIDKKMTNFLGNGEIFIRPGYHILLTNLYLNVT